MKSYLDNTGLTHVWGKIKEWVQGTYVPSARKINNKALSEDINLNAGDVGAYSKPASGIPKADLASDVQASLGKADTALQSYESEFVYVFDASHLNSSGKKTITSTEPYNAINTAFLAGKHVLAKVGNFDASMGMVDVFLPLVTLQLAPYTFMLNLKTPYGSFYVGAEVYTNKVIIEFLPI